MCVALVRLVQCDHSQVLLVVCCTLAAGCCVWRGQVLTYTRTYVCMWISILYSHTFSLVVQHSERVFRVPSAVTSLSFSTAHPNLLAVSGGRVGEGEG